MNARPVCVATRSIALAGSSACDPGDPAGTPSWGESGWGGAKVRAGQGSCRGSTAPTHTALTTSPRREHLCAARW
ncbi:MAG: hypothetical protein KA190_12940 [Kofleriaceae bacterium]|nr:hypothetical protein [Kofleriaceae bacterium]